MHIQHRTWNHFYFSSHPTGLCGVLFFWVVRPCLLHGAVLMDGIKNCDLQHPGDDDDDDDATSWIRELITYNREVPPQD